MSRRHAVACWLGLLGCWVLSGCVVSSSVAAAAEPWNRFRGPDGSGLSSVRGLPVAWTDADYRWTVDLPGTGISSPVLWGERLFVTAADDAKLERSLLCYATTDGKLLWSQAAPFEKEKKHQHNSYATGTPAVDAERVYVLWQSRAGSQLQAYAHDGRSAWSLDLGPYRSGHGGGISPVAVDGVVALNLNHEGESRLVGVDAATGKLRWSVPREKFKASYSTPCTFQDRGRRLLAFTSWKHGFTAVEPQSGAVVWELPEVFDPHDAEERRAINSPFAAGGTVYGACGFTAGKKILAAVRPGDAGSAAAELAFRIERNVNHMPSAIASAALLFLWVDAGILHCAQADTGKTLWIERLGGNYSASPVCIDGKLYGFSETGEAIVIAAAREFKELGRSTLPEGTAATPAVDDDAMYIRTYGKLLALPTKR